MISVSFKTGWYYFFKSLTLENKEDLIINKVVLSELWVLLKKADMKISAFFLLFLFSFLGIFSKIEIEKMKEDDQIEIFSNTGLLILIG